MAIVPELLPPGALLGRYQVRRTIGSGAMGVVLEAYDPQLERVVALKLGRGLGNGIEWGLRAHMRLVDEARAMARVVHPNVVVVYELFEVHGERVIAMEYVAGPDLASWPLSRPPPSERFRVVIEAGRGIAAAHEAGVVHGDIKPANILIGPGGQAKVSDFGLASRDDAPRRGGTPGFAAPEVVAGRPADRLADQYSFAVTAWLTLFDSRPEDAPPAADSALHRVLRRALAPEPGARFPSLLALIDALLAARRGRSASAADRWRGERHACSRRGAQGGRVADPGARTSAPGRGRRGPPGRAVRRGGPGRARWGAGCRW